LQFQDINEAHQVLIDPVRRAEYDAQWHPRAGEQPRPSRRPVHPRAHRRWHRHGHLRKVLLGLFAVLFVSSAWAVIFTAMNAAHSGGLNYAYDTSAPSGMVSSSPSCGYSMEIYPVSYVDEHGRAKTEWGTDAHNCYGGSTLIDAAPAARLARTGRFVNDPQVRQTF
jgi:curved DNA-binding protein CbpA